MAELHTGERADLEKKRVRLEEDLEIMEKHALEFGAAEDDLLEGMRKWDREHKDECLHSTPKARKHLR